MQLKARHTAIILLSLLISVIAEKAIPHSHVEHCEIVVADWESEKSQHEDPEGEELHSTYYRLCSFANPVDVTTFTKLILTSICCKDDIKSLKIKDYNLLPKVFNNILYVIHIYSSKDPPIHS